MTTANLDNNQTGFGSNRVMLRNWIISGMVILVFGFGTPRLSLAQQQQLAEEPAEAAVEHPAEEGGGRLLGDWGGLRDALDENGITLDLSYTNVFQDNVHGGTDTHNGFRSSGSYDLELTLDLEKLLGIRGASIFVLTEGSYGKGLSEGGKTGDLFGVNDDAGSDRSVDVTELWYEQSLFDDTLMFRAGKLDLTGGFECRGCPVSFDGNSYANDETAQFLNAALINNPTIPFPDNGLGVMIYHNPVPWFYWGIGAADAQADVRQTGFRTALHDEDHFFYVFETGIVAPCHSENGDLPGAYRFGLWYDPQPKERYFNDLGGRLRPRFRRDDVGFYLSFDQAVYRESSDSDQGLGLFWRYGFANGHVNELAQFWSVGGQYQGLIGGRDDDVLGLGVAQGMLSNKLRYYGDSPGQETIFETYYNIQVTDWLNISPDIQYIINPGGTHSATDCLVMGLRLQMSF